MEKLGISSPNQRIVPAFTVQALQRNTQVSPPKNPEKKKRNISTPSTFRKLYDRGDIPIGLKHNSRDNPICWRIPFDNLDYEYYLPFFVDGLKELTHPYELLVKYGIRDMLDHGGDKILPTVPKLIRPLKEALNTRNHKIMCTTLKVIIHLVQSAEFVGEALVPYYRQLLSVFNEYKIKNKNTGDRIDYSQRKQENIADLIEETLNALEKTGGQYSYINLKYMIPTYESCVHN